MKLSEVFDQLTHGELSQLSLGSGELGGIDVSNYPKLISHVNLGLTALYKRFPLKEAEIVVDLQEGRAVYPLTSGYAVTNPAVNGLTRFILDTVDAPFQDDILKIENVYTDLDVPMPLNDSSNIYSVFTPTAQTLRVPLIMVTTAMDVLDKYVTDTLKIVYRANHPILLASAVEDPALTDIELPYSHLEALLLFVASRVHNPIGMTNEFHAGNSYAAKYEQACGLLEVVNLNVDQGGQNTRIQNNGWV